MEREHQPQTEPRKFSYARWLRERVGEVRGTVAARGAVGVALCGTAFLVENPWLGLAFVLMGNVLVIDAAARLGGYPRKTLLERVASPLSRLRFHRN